MVYLYNLLYEHYNLCRVVAVFDKVLRHALTQILRLAVIDNLVVAVEELIYAWRVWQRRYLLLDMFPYGTHVVQKYEIF